MLQGTSRTFALTIPQLPGDLREAVSNAYLLCRTIDTIEDECSLGVSEKETFAHHFMEVLEGNHEPARLSANLLPRLTGSTLEAEKKLIGELDTLIAIYHSLPYAYQKPMRRCVRIMSEGMIRYQKAVPAHGLETLTDLNRYCYYVAGVVGEMLSDLYAAYCPQIQSSEHFLHQAVSFGQGLQMTNILKDIHDDRARGVCWLPRDVFARHGFDLDRLDSQAPDEAFAKAMRELVGIAHGHLRHAFDYTLSLPSEQTGIRNFCLWALGMAVLTLRKIDKNPRFRVGSEVKISRRSVKLTAALCSMSASNNARLRTLFRGATRPLPLTTITLPVPR